MAVARVSKRDNKAAQDYSVHAEAETWVKQVLHKQGVVHRHVPHKVITGPPFLVQLWQNCKHESCVTDQFMNITDASGDMVAAVCQEMLREQQVMSNVTAVVSACLLRHLSRYSLVVFRSCCSEVELQEDLCASHSIAPT